MKSLNLSQFSENSQIFSESLYLAHLIRYLLTIHITTVQYFFNFIFLICFWVLRQYFLDFSNNYCMGWCWFQQKDIKNRIYLYIFWQSEFIVHFLYLFFNFKGSNLFEIQFIARSLCLDVFSEEVDLISFLKLKHFLVPLIIVYGCLISNKLNIQAQLLVQLL